MQLDIIAEAEPAQPESHWMGFAKGLLRIRDQKATSSDNRFQCVMARKPDGSWCGQDEKKSASNTSYRFSICLTPFKLNLVVAGALNEEGHSWDCVFEGIWGVRDTKRFVDSLVVGQVWPAMPLTAETVQIRLLQKLLPDFRDEFQSHRRTIFQLRDEKVIPDSVWQRHLEKAFHEFGLSPRLDRLDWRSTEAELAKIQDQQFKEWQRHDEEAKRRNRAELDRLQMEREFEQQCTDTAFHIARNEHERQGQLKLIELEYQTRLNKLRQEIVEADNLAEAATLKHQIEMSRIKNQPLLEAEVAKRESEQQENYREMTQNLARMEAAVRELAGQPPQVVETLARLHGQALARADQNHKQVIEQNQEQNRILHQVLETLTSSFSGISPVTLGMMGYAASLQMLIKVVRDRSRMSGDEIHISNNRLMCRNIGSARKKADTLQINEVLSFSIISKRSGYLTLLNLGTSGDLFLMVPNSKCLPERSRVVVSQHFQIPGQPLYPWDETLFEEGPEGWEHILAIVSDTPLISTKLVVDSPDPLINLQPQVWQLLMSQLVSDSRAWSAGVLSFFVVNRN